MKPRNRITSGLFLIAMAALLMAPSAAADCVSKCKSDPVSGCASGVASGAASGGQFGAACVAGVNINIAITVFGDVAQCSVQMSSKATSCEGGNDRLIPNLLTPAR